MYIYAIKCGISRYYKIGHSADPDKRLDQLQCGCPMRLRFEIVAEIPDELAIEEYIQNHYDEQRIRGEWFDLSNKDLKDILAYLSKFKIVIPKLKRNQRASTVNLPKKI